jgi:hypothetical protein
MVVSMSEKEFSRLGVLMDVQARRLRVDDAAQLLKLKRRQIFRLLKGLRKDGAASLATKRRGRTSNNKLPAAVRELTMPIVRERYADFGPTLAAEKLRENHACLVSRETLRKWMIEVREAMDARAEHLVAEGLARRQGQCFVFANDLPNTLRQRESQASASSWRPSSWRSGQRSPAHDWRAGNRWISGVRPPSDVI